MGTFHPIYRRSKPKTWDLEKKKSSTTFFIDLTDIRLPPIEGSVADAAAGFDARAAATISAATGLAEGIEMGPSDNPNRGAMELLQEHNYKSRAPVVRSPRAKCLAALAYREYFPSSDFPHKRADELRGMVSEAIMKSNPGWCGSFGPGIDGTIDEILSIISSKWFGKHYEGNYDMTQMHLLQMAYHYYDELTEEAQNRLVNDLLARGTIHRPNLKDIFTSGEAPNDWSRVGYYEFPLPIIGRLFGIKIKVKRIGETENHILTIHTVRYLTNQLLYQRTHKPQYDNRRNGLVVKNIFDEKREVVLSCTTLMLGLLQGILQDDFSEYNAKNYQNEVRSALLNLCSYAYDHEVRLAARMVLDYISARIAVSSNDLRRMVPFRRRNEGKNTTTFGDGYMKVGLLEAALGADPMTQRFAILTGSTRAYQTSLKNPPHSWSIPTDGSNGNEAVIDALSDYRLPLSIHDLFVSDMHRRFFQRMHRIRMGDPDVTGRNADVSEIFSSSPSYLITAGGSPEQYAIDPYVLGITPPDQRQQLGVAVTTSFMPTGNSAGAFDPKHPMRLQHMAEDLIQLSSFSDKPGKMWNYGVAPDFACGHQVHLPQWVTPIKREQFDFVNRGSNGKGPGFYLALFRDGNFTALEAFDTWLHPNVDFDEFIESVEAKNAHIRQHGLKSNVEAEYTTQNGNRIRFVVWQDRVGTGARILKIEPGDGDPRDTFGRDSQLTDQFLHGTVMNGTHDGLVHITNPDLGTTITLDMRDQWHPKRTSETGEVEEAGNNHEVWVDFDWQGKNEGDFFQPFNSLAAAAAAVADGGVIKIVPGTTVRETTISRFNKRMRLVAPIGGVTIGHS